MKNLKNAQTLADFATSEEYWRYCREQEIKEKGSTIVTLSDGSTVEVIGKEYDLNELEREHDRELARKRNATLVVPPENGWYYTDAPDWDRM